MKYLLDTHAIVWARQDDPQLEAKARHAISITPSDELAIADITLLEISLLLSKKRIQSSLTIEKFLRMISAGIKVFPITVEIAARAADLKLSQGDPFDRLIVSTALEHRLTLITRDRIITESGLVLTLW